MASDYFLMGSSVADRTNRITIVKLVADKLNIDRTGYVHFFYLDNEIVIRKGGEEYEPDKEGKGFFMGLSAVDKDNRITLIKLVVQNLKIKESDDIEFYFHENDVIIRKTSERLKGYNPEETSKECHDAAATIYVELVGKINDYILMTGKHRISNEKEKEFFEEAVKMVDLSKLSKEDRNRLPSEMEYIARLTEDVDIYFQYMEKYSISYQKQAKELKDLETYLENFDKEMSGEKRSVSMEEKQIIENFQRPQKSKIKSIISKILNK